VGEGGEGGEISTSSGKFQKPFTWFWYFNTLINHILNNYWIINKQLLLFPKPNQNGLCGDVKAIFAPEGSGASIHKRALSPHLSLCSSGTSGVSISGYVLSPSQVTSRGPAVQPESNMSHCTVYLLAGLS
jgi:hypothetical protein